MVHFAGQPDRFKGPIQQRQSRWQLTSLSLQLRQLTGEIREV